MPDPILHWLRDRAQRAGGGTGRHRHHRREHLQRQHARLHPAGCQHRRGRLAVDPRPVGPRGRRRSGHRRRRDVDLACARPVPGRPVPRPEHQQQQRQHDVDPAPAGADGAQRADQRRSAEPARHLLQRLVGAGQRPVQSGGPDRGHRRRSDTDLDVQLGLVADVDGSDPGVAAVRVADRDQRLGRAGCPADRHPQRPDHPGDRGRPEPRTTCSISATTCSTRSRAWPRSRSPTRATARSRSTSATHRPRWSAAPP